MLTSSLLLPCNSIEMEQAGRTPPPGSAHGSRRHSSESQICEQHGQARSQKLLRRLQVLHCEPSGSRSRAGRKVAEQNWPLTANQISCLWSLLPRSGNSPKPDMEGMKTQKNGSDVQSNAVNHQLPSLTKEGHNFDKEGGSRSHRALHEHHQTFFTKFSRLSGELRAWSFIRKRFCSSQLPDLYSISI